MIVTFFSIWLCFFGVFESALRFSVVCNITRPRSADLKDRCRNHPLIPDDVDAEISPKVTKFVFGTDRPLSAVYCGIAEADRGPTSIGEKAGVKELIYSAQHCASPCQAANNQSES